MEKSLHPQTADLPGISIPTAPPAYDAMPSEQSDMSTTAQVQPSQQPQQIFIQYALGPQPVNLICPSCHQQYVSVIRPKSKTKTYLLSAILCITGLICCGHFGL